MRNGAELRAIASGVVVQLEQRDREELHVLRNREDLWEPLVREVESTVATEGYTSLGHLHKEHLLAFLRFCYMGWDEGVLFPCTVFIVTIAVTSTNSK